MFIPLVSSKPVPKLSIRKAGGGGGGHGGSGGGGGHASGSGGRSSTGTRGTPNLSGANHSPISIDSAGLSLKATPFGLGGGSKSTIPSTKPFGGREVGGGTRDQVYGTSSV